ncbi:hypothetical protein BXZ70DRAFT_955420 [Cristinia sonorae]|uniref:Microbial-type PARG catalytic domain-containing protein n=1 Tax=Cristinia sonorae TaxID=1940300 RepID=A0A8K0UH07_9AGAR|nr:hypothetical protein BXZ70DRAFT_955420 [Cristinia sonorae]
MAPHKPQIKSRSRRTYTPPPIAIMNIKSPKGMLDGKRQSVKRRHFKNRKGRELLPPLTPITPTKLSIDRKDIRDRWIEIAKETRSIVLGDGQYVEERCIPIDAYALAQRIEGFSMKPLGQVDSSSTVVALSHDISEQIQHSCSRTTFYPHEFPIDWAAPSQYRPRSTRKARIEFAHRSTLNVARRLTLHAPPSSSGVGILSFASRKKPGGGYLHGGDEQEDRLARHSSLVANLSSPAAKEFYAEHKRSWTQDGSGFHDRSMVYSPGVVVFRKDRDDREATDPLGGTFISPYTVDVLSVVPVNAAVVRSRYASASERESDLAVRNAMKDRMARALCVFEEQGNREIILGAFGCDSNENKLDIVADIWAELLVCGDMEGDGGSKREARFKHSFDTVVFAVPGKSFESFRVAFNNRLFEADLVKTLTSD